MYHWNRFSPAGTHPDATCKTLVRLTHINSWWYHEAGAQPADTLATVLHRLKACQAVPERQLRNIGNRKDVEGDMYS
jgi:hypothetical protein